MSTGTECENVKWLDGLCYVRLSGLIIPSI